MERGQKATVWHLKRKKCRSICWWRVNGFAEDTDVTSWRLFVLSLCFKSLGWETDALKCSEHQTDGLKDLLLSYLHMQLVQSESRIKGLSVALYTLNNNHRIIGLDQLLFSPFVRCFVYKQLLNAYIYMHKCKKHQCTV